MAKPASAVQDPYATSAPDQDGISFVAPPPGAPTDGSATLMKIYVPAEDTQMYLGVGSPPGIRMFTAHHVGLWAGAPQTTVDLGTNPGVSGIDIYTAAQKREVIALHTEESYQNTKTETVGLALTETFNNTKTENVAHALVENYHGTKNETVDHAVEEKYGATKQETVHAAAIHHYQSSLTEDVGGNWTVDPVKGDFTVHATGKIDLHGDGEHKWLQVGVADWLFMNNFKKTTVGSDWAIIVGVKHDLRVAVHNDFRIGAHVDTKIAARVVNQVGPWSQQYVIRKIDAAMQKLSTALYSLGTVTCLNKAASFIDSASLYLFN